MRESLKGGALEETEQKAPAGLDAPGELVQDRIDGIRGSVNHRVPGEDPC